MILWSFRKELLIKYLQCGSLTVANNNLPRECGFKLKIVRGCGALRQQASEESLHTHSELVAGSEKLADGSLQVACGFSGKYKPQVSSRLTYQVKVSFEPHTWSLKLHNAQAYSPVKILLVSLALHSAPPLEQPLRQHGYMSLSTA